MKYQDLIDADVSEFDIEQMVGEGWTLQQIAEECAPYILRQINKPTMGRVEEW